MNEYNSWTQEQLIEAISQNEQAAVVFYEQRSNAEKQGRAANKKVELMRKALTDKLLNAGKIGKK